jgi:hypothetical protein
VGERALARRRFCQHARRHPREPYLLDPVVAAPDALEPYSVALGVSPWGTETRPSPGLIYFAGSSNKRTLRGSKAAS